MNFLIIPKALGEQIGYIEFAQGKAIDLTACRLTGNRYAIDEETIDIIKANSAAILNYVPPNLRGRIQQVINMNKADHEIKSHEDLTPDIINEPRP